MEDSGKIYVRFRWDPVGLRWHPGGDRIRIDNFLSGKLNKMCRNLRSGAPECVRRTVGSGSSVGLLRILVLLRLALGILAAVQPELLRAQVSPLQVEFNVGLAVPTQEFAEPGGLEGSAKRGASFGVHLALSQRHVSWYVGFSEYRTQCGGDACAGDFISTAWDLGIRLNLLSGPVVPWLLVGTTAVITRARLADPLADPLPGGAIPTFAVDSDRSWGLEAGAGLMVPIARHLGVNAGVRYLRATPTFSGPVAGDLPIRVWVMELGLILGF